MGAEAVTPNQHFTKPPPRYSDGTLVKALEERGIGRPSTYASILKKLLVRSPCNVYHLLLPPEPDSGVI